MLDEIRTETGRTDVAILGVNGEGQESAVDLMVTGRTIPLLQDVPGVDAWTHWPAEYRDVWVLDDENRPVGLVSLLTKDLADPTVYQELKGMILAAMGL